jgi:hypothetical protein
MASTDLSLFLLAQSVGARPLATPLAEEMVALLGRVDILVLCHSEERSDEESLIRLLARGVLRDSSSLRSSE